MCMCHRKIPFYPHSDTLLQWHPNEHDGISSHRCQDCLPSCLFRHRSKKTSKLHVPGLCEGNPPVTSGFPSQRASNMENVSIWWHHHGMSCMSLCLFWHLSGETSKIRWGHTDFTYVWVTDDYFHQIITWSSDDLLSKYIVLFPADDGFYRWFIIDRQNNTEYHSNLFCGNQIQIPMQANLVNSLLDDASFPGVPFINTSRQKKMAAVLQTTFWNPFSWLKIIFWFNFHRNLFPRVQ